jgi:hypothetical protein
MTKVQMFLTGAASVLDLDASYARDRRHKAMHRLINTDTHKVRVSKGATPGGAFEAVGNHIRHAVRQHEQQYR